MQTLLNGKRSKRASGKPGKETETNELSLLVKSSWMPVPLTSGLATIRSRKGCFNRGCFLSDHVDLVCRMDTSLQFLDHFSQWSFLEGVWFTGIFGQV